MSAIADALFWRYGSNWGVFGAVFAVSILIQVVRLFEARLAPASVVFAIAGLLGVLLAATINLRTVTVTTSVFKTRMPSMPA